MKLITTILVRDIQEYSITDEYQTSVGRMVDEFLGDQYSHGQEVHSFHVEFDTADIEMFKKLIPMEDGIERHREEDGRDGHPDKKKVKSKESFRNG